MNVTSHTRLVCNRIRRFFLASIATLISCVLLAGGVCAQTQSGNSTNADSGVLPWLDVKAGCWEVRSQLVRTIKQATPQPGENGYIPSADEALQKVLAGMNSEQRARQMSPEQQAEWKKQYEVTATLMRQTLKQQAVMLNKGINTGPQTGLRCSASPFADARGAVYNAKDPAKHCIRVVADSNGVRHMHIACNDFSDDFERIDAEHFKGTTQVWSPANEADATSDHPFGKDTTTLTAKWISENSPHLPYSPPMTDLDGRRPTGPYGVGWFDPFRLVAEIDGKQFIAERAYLLINHVTVGSAQNYGPSLASIFQEIYMHYAVAATAVHMHLDQQQPWKSRLAAASDPSVDSFRNFDVHTERFATYSNEWNEIVDRGSPGHDGTAFIQQQGALWSEPTMNLLWDAYFSQYNTKAEKDAALQQVKEKYKLTILDPDFFAGTRRD